MDMSEIEVLADKIRALRRKSEQLKAEIRSEAGKLKEELAKRGVSNLKTSIHSIELARKIRRDFDFAALDRLGLPEDVMKKRYYSVVYIKSLISGKKPKLEGNKFVYD